MTQEVTALIGIVVTVLGIIIGYLAGKGRNAAEADKATAEAEKARAETEKIRRELELSSPPASTSPDKPGQSPTGEITVLTAERSLLSEYYLEQILSSTRIDMIALTLQSALEHFGQGRFIQWIKDGKHIRILMLSPYSAAARLRGLEEDSNESFLSDKITLQIKALKSLYNQAEANLKNQDITGSLEIRLYNDLPYFSYFHADNVMVMGLYYVHIRGLQSEALLIDETSSIHAKMCGHFDHIWTRSAGQKMTVCSLGKGRGRFNNSLLEDPQPASG